MAELAALVAGRPVSLTWILAAAPVSTLLVADDGSRVWTGAGPPLVIAGATAGDMYLDVEATSGDLYRGRGDPLVWEKITNIRGPIGPPGPPTDAADLAYLHTQVEPSTVWLITHGLAFPPAAVEVFDHLGDRHHPDVAWPSSTEVRLGFLTSVRGTARLS